MQNTPPPAKKQRTEGGLGKATSAGDNTDPTLKKKKQSNKKKKTKVVGRIAESRQFVLMNYRGALQEYLQKQGDFELHFETEQKNETIPKFPKMYISTCNANDIVGTGEAKSKKLASQLAALAVMKEMKLISAREYRSITKAAREAREAKKTKTAPKVVGEKKTKEELLKEREVDEEEKMYTGTVKFYRLVQNYGFISIDEEISFKGLTAKGRIYVSKDDIVCSSEEVGLDRNLKVIFKLYKDSMGIGAYDVQNEDGTPIIFERKAEKSGKAGDAGNMVKTKRKKKTKIGQMIENKQYLVRNFRGALQEYIKKKYPEVKLEFETEVQEPNTKSPVFIATCKAVGAEIDKLKELVGTGHASSKKAAIHFSALEYMLKLNLLSAKQHFKIHHQNKDGSAVASK